MIKIDSKDVEIYNLVTDVPYVSSPCVYILFLLSIFLPGRVFLNMRIRHNDSQLLRKAMLQDTILSRFASILPDFLHHWVGPLDLLGCTPCHQEPEG